MEPGGSVVCNLFIGEVLGDEAAVSAKQFVELLSEVVGEITVVPVRGQEANVVVVATKPAAAVKRRKLG